MSVPKSKRKESQFEVIKHFYRLRKDITDLLLRDFGYSEKKAKQKLEKRFGGKAYEELSEEEKMHYEKIKIKNEAFDEWFIKHRREVIIDCITNACEYIFTANSIYPSIPEELTERRINLSKQFQ